MPVPGGNLVIPGQDILLQGDAVAVDLGVDLGHFRAIAEGLLGMVVAMVMVGMGDAAAIGEDMGVEMGIGIQGFLT
jgi:methionine aminopeptidase